MMQPQGHLQVAASLFYDQVDPQAALDRPRFQLAGGSSAGIVRLEPSMEGVAAGLQARGHVVEMASQQERSGFDRGQVILRADGDAKLWWAGSDPRGDGYPAAVY